MTAAPSTPAGWYPDPWKHAPLRYWDGSGWTGATGGGVPIAASPESSRAPLPPPPTRREKGSELEQKVAHFLQTLGYSTTTNVVLTGRSGATHEIDVLAEKSDELATRRVAVECKAWAHPIEKDVVAKFHYVLGDLGIGEGIVACLSGYRTGAEAAAREMGVMLWGPDELHSRLGQVVLRDISTGSPKRLASGLPFRVSQAEARSLIEKETCGKLGMGGEEIVWMSPAWIPVAVVQVALTSVEGRIKKVAQTRRIWNAYELVGSTLSSSSSIAPEFVEVDLGGTSLRPKVKLVAARKAIEEAVAKYRGVTAPAAKERHASRLHALGIPAPYRAVAESEVEAYLPIYVAFARRKGGERVVAVDGLRPTIRTGLSSVLTQNSHWLRESLASK